MTSLKRAPVTADVAVIGAGIIGASIALDLSRKGHRVCIVDKLRGGDKGPPPTRVVSAACSTLFKTQ